MVDFCAIVFETMVFVHLRCLRNKFVDLSKQILSARCKSLKYFVWGDSHQKLIQRRMIFFHHVFINQYETPLMYMGKYQQASSIFICNFA